MRYAQASAAADAGDWEQAVAGYSMVAEADSAYRDTKARLAQARQQHQLATLLAEAHRLHRTGQWAAVIKVGERLQAIDPDVADPGGLITAARAELAAEQQAAKLAADYHTALRLFDAGRWEEAVEALELVSRLDSAYQDAPALLDRARRELGQVPAALSEEEVRREAEEQDRPRAEEQDRPRAEEQDRPRAEEQAWPEQEARRQAEQRGDTPHPRGTWILICGILGIFITIFAPIAWYQGNKARREVQAPGIHYSNELSIRIGRMLGKIFTIFGIVYLAVLIIGGVGNLVIYMMEGS